jgi:uncharacterized protein YbjT (DUF2867 family)
MEEQKQLVVVTGATGFLASHVIEQLLGSGQYRVRATTRNPKVPMRAASTVMQLMV